MISSLFYDDIPVYIHLKYVYYAKGSSFCFGGLIQQVYTFMFSYYNYLISQRLGNDSDSVSLNPSFTWAYTALIGQIWRSLFWLVYCLQHMMEKKHPLHYIWMSILSDYKPHNDVMMVLILPYQFEPESV